MRTTVVCILSALAVCACAQSLPSSLQTTEEALAAYVEVTGRTILRSIIPSQLTSAITLPLPEDPAYGQQVTNLITTELAKIGVLVIPQGQKFVVVQPEGWSIQLPAPPEVLPAGTINFPGADLDDVLEIYSVLRKRTMLRPAGLPAPLIRLRTESDLTLEETVYAFEAVFALNGIAVVDDGEKFVQIVPWSMASQVKAESPGRNPEDELIAVKTIPKFDGSLRSRPSSSASAVSKIQRMKPASAERMLEYYATLLQSKALPSPQLSEVPVVFRAQSPLTQPELLYGLRTVLGLNGLTIEQEGDGSIRLEPASEVDQPGR